MSPEATVSHAELVSKVREVHEIQSWHGNWNYSPYMRGLFNGLELAMAILEDREPSYKDSPILPDRYLCDQPSYEGAPMSNTSPLMRARNFGAEGE